MADRTKGTAVFLTGNPNVVPVTLLHNLKHNKTLYERVIILTVCTNDVPWRKPENRANYNSLKMNFGL